MSTSQPGAPSSRPPVDAPRSRLRFFGRLVLWTTRAVFYTTVGKVLALTLAATASTVQALAYTADHHDELVLVSSFGKNVRGPLEPGIYWYMPYFNTIRRYPTTVEFLLVTDKRVEADKPFMESLYEEVIALTTKDNIPITVVLEVKYQIQKSQRTVNAFVEHFGRASSAYGTEKIEKAIADACRNAARSVLGNARLSEIETDNNPPGSRILEMAMGHGMEGAPTAF